MSKIRRFRADKIEYHSDTGMNILFETGIRQAGWKSELLAEDISMEPELIFL